MSRLFSDRADAGRALALRLQQYAADRTAIVIALPRGGVPVGYEIASALHLPLDVLLVRKIGVPDHPEMAMGAVSDDGTYVVNQAAIDELKIPRSAFFAVLHVELAEAKRRRTAYCTQRSRPDIRGRTAIVVDDGIATGATMRLALDVLRRQGAAKLVLAVPVAPLESRNDFNGLADEFVCVHTPFPFVAVGAHYTRFAQNSDSEVCELLSLGTLRSSREEGHMNDDTISDMPDDDADKNVRTDQTMTAPRTERGEIGDDDLEDDTTETGTSGTASRSDSGAGE
ncbi:MAG TPA: phosphoribosyltransferase [Candidatus Baltobacteraceae bacterium]|nr:phosphoribosyltransferase [Candidatus Baltobacteraceae bacterium]